MDDLELQAIGSLLAEYATKTMLNTAAKTAMRGTLDAAKRAVPHLIAYKVASTIAASAKKRKRVDNRCENIAKSLS